MLQAYSHFRLRQMHQLSISKAFISFVRTKTITFRGRKSGFSKEPDLWMPVQQNDGVTIPVSRADVKHGSGRIRLGRCHVERGQHLRRGADVAHGLAVMLHDDAPPFVHHRQRRQPSQP